VKVVPGASRTRIVGPHGAGIRVQIAAAAERGRANDALVELLAETLGVSTTQVEIVAGHASPRKTVRIRGITSARLAECMSRYGGDRPVRRSIAMPNEKCAHRSCSCPAPKGKTYCSDHCRDNASKSGGGGSCNCGHSSCR
jgi:uncharacterized protein (TIGR00251 family)